MDAQKFGGTALIAVGAFEHAFDKALLKFPHGFVEQDAAFNHLNDKPFQLISHVTLSVRANL